MQENIKSFDYKNKFTKILVITFIIGLIAHAYCYFSIPLVHDALIVHQGDDVLWKVALGRFMIVFCNKLRGDLITPWLIGFLALFWISVANYFVIITLNIKSIIKQILICGILTTNISVTLLGASYINDLDINMFAFMCSVFVIFLLEKYKYGFLLAIPFLTMCLGTYQAFLQVTIVFGLVVFIKKIFDKADNKELMAYVIKAVIMTVLSLIFFFIISKCFINYYGISESTNGNSAFSVFELQFSEIASLIMYMAYYIFRFFIFPTTAILSFSNLNFISIFNILLIFSLGIIYFIKIVRSKLTLCKKVISLLFCVLFPFCIAFVYILAQGSFHLLMTMSFNFVYVFLIFLLPDFTFKYFDLNKIKFYLKTWKLNFKKYVSAVICAVLAIIILNNVVVANQMYLYTQLRFESTLSTMTRIIDRIEETEGYIPGETPVIIIGTIAYGDQDVNELRQGFEHLYTATGQNYLAGTTYTRMYEWYFEYILGYNINIIPSSTYSLVPDDYYDIYDSYAQDEYVMEMPNFPYADSVQMVNGVVIVKLSNK